MDLELHTKDKFRLSLEGYDLSCRIDKNLKHRLHSESDHLNGLTDLIISLGQHLEIERGTNYKNLIDLKEALASSLSIIKKLTEQVDFIKNQNDSLLIELKRINKRQDIVINLSEENKQTRANNTEIFNEVSNILILLVSNKKEHSFIALIHLNIR